MRPREHRAAAAVALALVVAACSPGSGASAPGSESTQPPAPAADAVAERGPRPDELTAPRAAGEVGPFYAPWARVLATWVDDEGLVDYAGLKERGRDDLRAFVASLADFDVSTLDGEAERIAFWINAYNAVVVWQVVEAHPIDSVRDVGAFWGLVGGFFKQDNRVAGEERSLDDIEHGILRSRYADPRIHWALVCAAFGCPRLIRRPYLASDLDAVLTAQSYEFLAQPRALQVDRERGILHLSSYFDWYAGDFEAAAGGVVDYVLRYAPDAEASWIRDHREALRIRFIDYDWTLNDQPKGPRIRRPVELAQ